MTDLWSNLTSIRFVIVYHLFADGQLNALNKSIHLANCLQCLNMFTLQLPEFMRPIHVSQNSLFINQSIMSVAPFGQHPSGGVFRLMGSYMCNASGAVSILQTMSNLKPKV
jgi:hypothetical protein